MVDQRKGISVYFSHPRVSYFSIFILVFSLIFFSTSQAEVENEKSTTPPLGFYLESGRYKDNVYSKSKKTELGDQTRVDVSFRYQKDVNTFGVFHFETDPLDDRVDNKTSKFELIGGHKVDNFSIQIDTQLNTNDNGGTTLGLDLKSKSTFLSYSEGPSTWTFYPFNFNGEVGREFNTYDVTRIFFVEGSPSTVNNTPLSSELINEKTIPGLEFKFTQSQYFSFYLGAGVASFLYPANENFNIATNRTADRWERKEDVGYKLGANYEFENTSFSFQYVGHQQAQYTGSRLESAASLGLRTFLDRFLIDGEWTMSKAGQAPYRLSRTSGWFEQTAPFQPIYSDYYGATQDWVGKTDSAFALKIGFKTSDNSLPYFFYRYQGQHFIFRERESAHLLRTADETSSHGGLSRVGIGAYRIYGNFKLNPEFEWLKARNAVFSNSSDVRSDRVLASFRDEDFLLRMTVSYSFNGQNLIK